MAEHNESDAPLDLSGDGPERKTIILPDGSESRMRAVGELSIKELKSMRKLQGGDNDIDDMVGVLDMILIDATVEQIEDLSVDACNRIVDFFSKAVDVPEQTDTPAQSPKRKGSTAAA